MTRQIHRGDIPEIEMPLDYNMKISAGSKVVNLNTEDFRAKLAFPFNFSASQFLGPYKHIAFFSAEYFNVTVNNLKKFFDPNKYLCSHRSGDTIRFLYEYEGGYLNIQFSKNEKILNIEGHYLDYKTSMEVNEKFNKEFPKKKDNISSTVPIEFWHHAGQGEGHRTYKQLENTPSWKDISNNYAKNVKNYLTNLMDSKRIGGADGRLILWRGLPGTGKTFAIRALIREWKDWCNSHYIIDPEAFFTNPAYLLNVLFRINENERYDDDGNSLSDFKQKWNLLILEDAGELIVSDAKAQTGPALSKLLNLADGMLGQGMNLLVLITTNEEDNRLDKAVSRNGRCLSSILFTEFDTTEAREWLDVKGSTVALPAQKTISDLYALVNDSGTKKNKVERKVGFTS